MAVQFYFSSSQTGFQQIHI